MTHPTSENRDTHKKMKPNMNGSGTFQPPKIVGPDQNLGQRKHAMPKITKHSNG